MKHLTEACRAASRDQNWYAALTLALTFPDICGRLENPAMGSQARYVQWCSRYLEPKYVTRAGRVLLSGRDCYGLRCAVLHEGSDDIVGQRAREVLNGFDFTQPIATWVVHNNLVDNKLQLQVDLFAEDVCSGVDQWMTAIAGNADVEASVALLMKVRGPEPDGSFSI